MFKKPVVTSLILITIGILFGAVLVSNIGGGVDLGFARGSGEVRLGGPAPAIPQGVGLKELSNTFVSVAKAVTPTVVGIQAKSSAKGKSQSMPRDFFHFFGPDFQMPEQDQPTEGFGSGVILTSDGYIVTNNHVVDGADKDGVKVIMHDKIYYDAKVIGTDPTTDIAVLKIDGKNLPMAALGNSDDVQVGEWVLAVGNPLNLTSTVTAGIISAIGRNIRITNDQYGIENFIQTDAAINPGNSGGSLVNMKGEVIGINAAIATTNGRYQGYGFAVPVNLMKTVAEDLIKYGKVNRGYIGVKIQSVDQTFGDAIGLNKAEGVVIQEVVKGGAAEIAGLKNGDVILSVDGKEVNESNELQSYVAQHHPGDKVELKIFREGKTFEKTVTLKGREDEKTTVATADEGTKGDDQESAEPVKSMKLDKLGLTVRPPTGDEKKEMSISSGVVVSDVAVYSESFQRGLTRGDVIVEADRQEVSSPKELKKIFDSHKAGEAILLRVKHGTDPARFVAVQIPK